jgi:uncharacterized protein
LTPASAGQYQHDVNQFDLARSLDTVVEDRCEQCRRGPGTLPAQLLLARVSARRRRLSVVARLARREWRICQLADSLKVITCRKPEQKRWLLRLFVQQFNLHMQRAPKTYAVVEKSWPTLAGR